MDITTYFLIGSTLLGFCFGPLIYCIKTIKGEVKPNKITWLFWSVPLITVTAQYLEGMITWASLTVFMSGFAPFLIFLSSFINPKSYWKLEKFDYMLSVGIIIFLIFWAISQNIFFAIIFSIIADALASIPTLKKAYYFPETETVWPFLVGFINSTLSLFIMERYDFIEMAFPVYLVFVCLLFIY